jgi:hypothetical protein
MVPVQKDCQATLGAPPLEARMDTIAPPPPLSGF